MATAYQIESSFQWVLYRGIPHIYGGAIYIRLYQWGSSSARIRMYKSTDNGQTWAMAGGSGILTEGGPNMQPGCGTVRGSIIYVSYWDSPTGQMSVARFDMATDSWLTTWGGGPSVAFSYHSQVGVKSDGSLVVVYDKLNSGSYEYYHTTVSSAGAWGGSGSFLGSNTSGFRYDGPVLIDSTDTPHFIYSHGGSWIGDGATITSSAGNAHNAEIVTIGGVPHIVVAFEPTPSAPVVYYKPVGSGSWTASTPPSSTVVFWLAKTGNTIYGTWPNSVSVSSAIGVEFGTFEEGVWSGSVDLYTTAQNWFYWTANGLLSPGKFAVVMESDADQTPWFLYYDEAVSGCRYRSI